MSQENQDDGATFGACFCGTGGKPFDAGLPTVVLLHGALNDHSVWSKQARGLADAGWNVLAPDLPGHGRSVGPALNSVEALADWLLALLDSAGVRRAALVGHSMGSLIALAAAARAPDRVSHLALVGSTWPMKVSGKLLDLAQTDEPAAIGMVARWSHAESADPAIGAASRALMARLAEPNPGHLLYTDLRACQAYAGGMEAAAAVACPTLFVFGSQDVMTAPASAQGLLAAIAGARSVTVEAGHQMMVEQPDAVLAALTGLLTQS